MQTQIEPNQDEVIYQDANIKITRDVAKIHEKTFSIKNIGSLEIDCPMNINNPFFVGVVSIIWATFAEAKVIPITGAIISAIWFFYEMKITRLIIVSGGGEVNAYQNTDKKQVEIIRDSILKAISLR